MTISRMGRIIGACGLALALLVFGGSSAFAQSGGAQSFTLQPNGTATITFEGYCTNFGQKFPTSVQAPNAVAPDKIRGALAYIQSNNISASADKALEAQYAIWQLSGATNSPAGGADAKAVVDASSSAPANPQGTSVLDAAKAGQVTLTVASWQPIGDKVAIGAASDNFYGRGTLTVKNVSNEALTLYLPLGALFPPATAGDQTMAAYSTNTDVSNPQPASQGTGSQPGRLPQTADGAADNSWLFLIGGIALLGTGLVLRRQFVRNS